MKLSKVISSSAAALLLIGLTVPTFALAAGYIKLPERSGVATRPPITTLAPMTGNPTFQEPTVPSSTQSPTAPATGEDRVYLDNLSKVMLPSRIDALITDRTTVTQAERAADYNRLIGSYNSYVSGTALMSTEDYDPSSFELTQGKVYTLPYSSGRETTTIYRRKYSDADSSYVTVANELIIERKSLKPYMGYLLLTTGDGSKTALLNEYGDQLAENIAGYEPAYLRDNENRPVFTDGTGYFIFDAETAAMVSIKREKLRTGLSYDYPAYELSPEGYESRWVSEKSQRFFEPESSRYRLDYYGTAFNFSEGYAVVTSSDSTREMRIIDTAGKRIFSPRTWYNFHTGIVDQVMYVSDKFALPDTLGIESIGCQGFDRGWVRVRVKTYGLTYPAIDMVVKDEDRLLDHDRNEFEIPIGYTLKGYSDGVLLLEKDGRYGYYSIDHKWIAQPLYTYATPFIQGLAVVGFENGTLGMIDTDGNIVLPFVFTTLSTPSSGVIVGYNEAVGYQTFYISAKGE